VKARRLSTLSLLAVTVGGCSEGRPLECEALGRHLTAQSFPPQLELDPQPVLSRLTFGDSSGFGTTLIGEDHFLGNEAFIKAGDSARLRFRIVGRELEGRVTSAFATSVWAMLEGQPLQQEAVSIEVRGDAGSVQELDVLFSFDVESPILRHGYNQVWLVLLRDGVPWSMARSIALFVNEIVPPESVPISQNVTSERDVSRFEIEGSSLRIEHGFSTTVEEGECRDGFVQTSAIVALRGRDFVRLSDRSGFLLAVNLPPGGTAFIRESINLGPSEGSVFSFFELSGVRMPTQTYDCPDDCLLQPEFWNDSLLLGGIDLR